jgi:hypothetical protein
MAIMAQRDWRWCKKCQGLWYAAATQNPTGKCPAGGGHDKTVSGDYALFGDPDGAFSTTVMAQRRWSWCQNCQGLWYSGATQNPTGKCAGTTPPGSGGHVKAGSADYALFGDSDGNLAD